jgi:hypothetical protein
MLTQSFKLVLEIGTVSGILSPVLNLYVGDSCRDILRKRISTVTRTLTRKM